jgi:CRP-like cAMP-binding protein
MENFGLYKKLINLPLFVGMGRDELEQIIAHTKFNFIKIRNGNNIVEEGEKNGQLLLLVDGEIEMETHAHDNGYTVYEYLKAPYMLQPERTFGLTQRYSSTIKALTTCSLICIDKNETLRLTSDSLIFRLNLFNIISTALQKQMRQGWRSVPQSLNHRIVRFVLSHCTHPAGRKIFKIKMNRLAGELNDSRLHISQALNSLADQGLMILSRGKIEIPAVEQLARSVIS